jgi:acyl-CoA synthetase (AMP-forming)/AMP-acid ligase II
MTAPAIDYVSAHASSQPAVPAVIEGDDVTNWAELESRANRWAHVLVGLGVQPGTKIVWCGPNSTEVVLIVAAARKAAAVAVPLNYRLTPTEASYVIDNSDATVVLFDVEQTAQLEPARAQCPKVTAWVAFRDRG